MSAAARILIVDDEEFVRESLAELLRAHGHEVATARNGNEAVQWLESHRCDVILSDLRMPRADGMSLLAQARRHDARIPIVLITGAGTVQDAVQAMRQGAFDFVLKPVEPDALLRLMNRAVEHSRLQGELAGLRTSMATWRRREALIGSSARMQRLRQEIERCARARSVLIAGPSGSGKELIAREWHLHGPRAKEALVGFDPLRDTLAERALQAEGGTLMLLNVGESGPALQLELARLIEQGEVRSAAGGTRVLHLGIAALLKQEPGCADALAALRPELRAALGGARIDAPALREHLEDLPELCAHLLLHASGPDQRTTQLSEEALAELREHEWSGNVDELRNVLERASLAASPDAPMAGLQAENLREQLRPLASRPAESSGGELTRLLEFNLRRNVDARERELVIGALARAKGIKKEACELLGIDPRNLGYYVRKHRIRDVEWSR
jgi:DNA-binding NtrC family response regulator